MTSFDQELTDRVLDSLKEANSTFNDLYPGDSPARQPVHTVYGGAHIFNAGTVGKLGAAAQRSMEEYAPNPSAFAKALGLKGKASDHRILYNRVVDKLERE